MTRPYDTINPARGERPAGFIQHPHSLVESEQIGRGSRISAFAHVLLGAVLGEDVTVGGHALVDGTVTVGSRVTISGGAKLLGILHLEDDVFVGSNATFEDVIGPPGNRAAERGAATRVCRRAWIGANVTILPGVVIGEGAVADAGSVVTRDVPPNAVVAGNPARIRGYVDTPNVPIFTLPVSVQGAGISLPALRVAGASLHRLPKVVDLRGALSFAEVGTHLPFVPKRFFVVYDVPGKEVRGEHAHKALHQFLVCLKGSCRVVVDDGSVRDEVILDTPEIGLHIPPMVWGIQYMYTENALMLVLASDVYQADDYIRDYGQFSSMVKP